MELYPARVLQFVLVAFMIGVFVGSSFIFPQKVILYIVFASIVGILFFSNKKFFNSLLALLCFCVLIFAIGTIRINSVILGNHPLKEFTQQTKAAAESTHASKVELIGYVDSFPAPKNNYREFVFRSLVLQVGGRQFKIDEKVLVSVASSKEVSFGDKLYLNGSLLLPENTDDFDYISYLAKDGVFTLMKNPEVQTTDFPISKYENIKMAFLKKIFVFRSAFENSINRSLPQPESGFVDGILIGSTSGISSDLKKDFAKTGTSHIIAVSGYNISLVVVLLSAIFLKFMGRKRAFWFTILAIAIYALLTGASASVMRAAVMGIILLLAQRMGRLYNSSNAIILAGAIMVIINPMLLKFDVGFQLSFLATLGILLLSPSIKNWCDRIPWLDRISEPLSLTLSAEILVLPLILFYFKVLSLTSLPANLLALPTIPYIMMAGFVTGIGGIIWHDLGSILGIITHVLAAIPLKIIHFFASFRWATLDVSLPAWATAMCYVIIILYLIILNKKQNRLI